MPISFEQFSKIAELTDIHARDIVSIDSRQDLRVGRSRFRLVRWVLDSGIGRHLKNRRTVRAFSNSLRSRFGSEFMDKFDAPALQALERSGKPLRVRDIKAVLDTAQLDKSNALESLINEHVNEHIRVDLHAPEDGQALLDEIIAKVDMDELKQNAASNLALMEARGTNLPPIILGAAENNVEGAVNQALDEIFLVGYAETKTGGRQFDRLQQCLDQHPLARRLYERGGPRFVASRLSPELHESLSIKLHKAIMAGIKDPGDLPAGAGTIKEKMTARLDQVTSKVVGRFVEERISVLEQMEQLQQAPPGHNERIGELIDKTAASTGFNHVVLNNRVPPSILPQLFELHAQVPDNLVDLASAQHGVEHKVQLLQQFAGVLSELKPKVFEQASVADRETYLASADDRALREEVCSRFLLEGKLSDVGSSGAVKNALLGPDSGLSQLHGTVFSLLAECRKKGNEFWGEAAEAPLTDLMKTIQMVTEFTKIKGSTREYHHIAGDILSALRNSGIEVPPPDNLNVEQSGEGAFSQAAQQYVETGISQGLREFGVASADYPGFVDQAIRDFNRANYSVDGTQIKRTDENGGGRKAEDIRDDVTAGVRSFCTDVKGELDGRMLDTVGRLINQRSFSPVMGCFSPGMDAGKSLLRTAPFRGIPSGETSVQNSSSSSYSLSRSDDGNVIAELGLRQKTKVLQHLDSLVFLDPDQSELQVNLKLEIDAGDYSVKVTDMNYRFHFVPAEASP